MKVDTHGALHDNLGQYANQNQPAAGYDLTTPGSATNSGGDTINGQAVTVQDLADGFGDYVSSTGGLSVGGRRVKALGHVYVIVEPAPDGLTVRGQWGGQEFTAAVPGTFGDPLDKDQVAAAILAHRDGPGALAQVVTQANAARDEVRAAMPAELEEAFRADAAAYTGPVHNFDGQPHGWTADVIRDIAADMPEHQVSDYAQYVRDTTPTGQRSVGGSVLRFGGLSPYTQAKVADLLGAGAKRDRHGDAPTTGTIVALAAKSGGKIRPTGYVVGPGREDERVTFDGVTIELGDRGTAAVRAAVEDVEHANQMRVDAADKARAAFRASHPEPPSAWEDGITAAAKKWRVTQWQQWNRAESEYTRTATEALDKQHDIAEAALRDVTAEALRGVKAGKLVDGDAGLAVEVSMTETQGRPAVHLWWD